MSTESHHLRCRFCEDHEHADHDSARCLLDQGFLSDELLETLQRVTIELPDITLDDVARGRCTRERVEMRRLPDGCKPA
jgi:hypothetical protein